MSKAMLRTGATDIYYSKPRKQKSKTIYVRPTAKPRVITTIYWGNKVLMITSACPDDWARCAINCLNEKPAKQHTYEHVDETRAYIPRYSKFVNQMGRLRP